MNKNKQKSSPWVSVAPKPKRWPTAQPVTVNPTPVPAPYPTPTPAVMMPAPSTTGAPSPNIDSIGGVRIIDAMNMTETVTVVDNQKVRKLFLLNANNWKNKIEFGDPSRLMANPSEFRGVKLFVKNESYLPVMKINGETMWVVNHVFLNALHAKSDGIVVVPVNAYGDMFSQTSYDTFGREEKMSVVADHGFLELIIVVLLSVLFFTVVGKMGGARRISTRL